MKTDEQMLEQTVDERDAAQEAMSQAYYLITGRSPEWSNLFGYKEALQEIDDAQRLLRDAARRLQVASGEALRTGVDGEIATELSVASANLRDVLKAGQETEAPRPCCGRPDNECDCDPQQPNGLT